MSTIEEASKLVRRLMKHHHGATKKLAPSMDPESSCPHEFTDEDDFQLEIDCGDCAGANDLTNSVCLSRAISTACYGATAETIVLKRMIHKRYRGAIVRTVTSLAIELTAINRAISSSKIPSDKECRTCPASTRQVLFAAKNALLEDPTAYARSREIRLAELRSISSARPCKGSSECMTRALDVLRR
ncbi:MAG TPA: hypothetical protein VGB78_10235 [Thermoplasmata archaeon]